MPLYEYRCPNCSKTQTAIRKINERLDSPECQDCKVSTKQILSKSSLPQVDPIILGGGTYQGYKCPVTDEYVTSKRTRREIMKEHDLVEKG